MHRCLVEYQADNLLLDAFIEHPSTKRLLRQVQKMKGDIVAFLPSHKTIAAVVTDDAGHCGRARRLLAQRWPGIAFIRCFAHDINNLVKQVLKSIFRTTAREAATAVNTLNASYSKWLRLLQDVQKQEYDKTRAMIALCPNRQNSMQDCFTSSLRSKTALTILSCRYACSGGWPSSLRKPECREFWTSLAEAKRVYLISCFLLLPA
ncbi:hypothetical protein PHPALM_14802 [Phytophthora palmivora]|uniref:DUF659 domain-containing protein n=1 Tax=Phytophthora palmivora TaxID=4796 RepID=A0A2P4XTV9_9STRA|nr:hypothetical protein PHPALM_14802 [Phytophthora palmivora]